MIARQLIRSAGALATSVLLAGAALAQAGDSVTATRAWTNCLGGLDIWAELRISGCTEVIKSKAATNEERGRALYNRANAYLNKGEYRRSIGDYDRALEITPGDANALHERCWARAVLDSELDDALSDCNEALLIRPDDHAILGARGFVYLRMGIYRTAISDYDAALAAEPANAEYLFARGTAKLYAGDAEGGAADIAAAKAINPKIEAVFARYDEAGEGGIWGWTLALWRSVMKFLY